MLILALVCLIVFHISANIIWLILNRTPPTWDAALHTTISINYLEYLKNNFFQFNLMDFLRLTTYYPPFVHWVGSIFAFLGNSYHKSVQLTGTFFFALSILLTFLYARALFKSAFIAFVSAFFFSFFITIYQQSRSHMLDLPLTSLVLLTLLFLQKSKLLTNKKNSLLFFVTLALSVLTKWYAPLFVVIPLVFYIPSFIKIIKKGEKKFITNLLLGIIVFATITLPWYISNYQSLTSAISVNAQGELADPQKLLSFENLFFYLKLIIMFQLSFFGFIFFLLSVALIIVDIVKNHKYQLSLLTTAAQVIFIYSVFTFIGNKNIRYLIPLMPFVAIIMGYGALKLLKQQNILCKIIPLLLSVYMFVSFFILSFGVPTYPKYKYALQFPLLGWVDIYYLHYYPVRVIYDKTELPNKQILQNILSNYSLIKETSANKIGLLLLVNTEYVNDGNMSPVLYPDLPIVKKRLVSLPYHLLLDKTTAEQMQQFLSEYVDWVLVAKNYLGLKEAIREYDAVKRFQQYFLNGLSQGFVLVKKYKINGDEFSPADTLLLYKKII